MSYNTNLLSKMIGQTIVKIEGMEEGSEDCLFTSAEGNTLRLYYEHDCCASCDIVQVDGDAKDLIGCPLVMCEEVSEGLPTMDIDGNTYDDSKDRWDQKCDESFTWTFYKFATVKGYVTLRWYGSSNGYYSESVTALYNDAEENGYVPYGFSMRNNA